MEHAIAGYSFMPYAVQIEFMFVTLLTLKNYYYLVWYNIVYKIAVNV